MFYFWWVPSFVWVAVEQGGRARRRRFPFVAPALALLLAVPTRSRCRKGQRWQVVRNKEFLGGAHTHW